MTNASLYQFSVCPFCGWEGFATEALATAYAKAKNRHGCKVKVLQCPAGAGRFHTTDEKVKSVEDFKTMLLHVRPRPKVKDAPKDDAKTFFGGLGDVPTLAKVLEATPASEAGAPLPPALAPSNDEESDEESDEEPRRRRRVCRKIGYGTEALAKRMLEVAISSGRDEKRYYQCEHCDKWHLTSLESERDPDQIVHTEMAVLPLRDGRNLVVSEGYWPDKTFAGITLTIDRGGYFVRVQPEHVPVLHEIFTLHATEAK